MKCSILSCVLVLILGKNSQIVENNENVAYFRVFSLITWSFNFAAQGPSKTAKNHKNRDRPKTRRTILMSFCQLIELMNILRLTRDSTGSNRMRPSKTGFSVHRKNIFSRLSKGLSSFLNCYRMWLEQHYLLTKGYQISPSNNRVIPLFVIFSHFFEPSPCKNVMWTFFLYLAYFRPGFDDPTYILLGRKICNVIWPLQTLSQLELKYTDYFFSNKFINVFLDLNKITVLKRTKTIASL